MDNYMQRYNSLTAAANPDPAGAPQTAPQSVPPRAAPAPTTSPNYLPQAPMGSPTLPNSVVRPDLVQQQQQSIGQEFTPVLQQLVQLGQKYPEGNEQLQQAAALVMQVMQGIAAQFSQGGLPRSIV